MGKYKAYPDYRNSGNKWLGDMPSHWLIRRIKHVGKVIGGYAFKSTDFSSNGVKVIKISNVSHLSFDWSDSSYLPDKFLAEQKAYVPPKNSLIFAMTRPIISGGVKVAKLDVDETLLINQRVGFLKPSNDINQDYLMYLTQSVSFFCAFENNTTVTNQPNISSEGIEDIHFMAPSLIEQEKIANFLDHETAKIDTLIEKQQQLIKLLKEKRQAVISHAVTKGLNPSALMRDSGVEWLGKVPEGWDVNSINYALNAIGDVDHYMPQSVEKGIPYLMTGDLKELASSINFENCKQVSHKDYLKLSKKIKSSRGDVIMARYATIGTASYIDVDTDFLVSYSCVTIKPNLSKVFGLYLFYYFKSDAFLQGIQNQVNTNTQGNVGVNDLKKIKVALPTLAEQSRIIEYLQSITSKLNSISDRSQAAIDLMKERRIALISAAVTGKIDVRNWQAPEPSNKNNKVVGA